MAHDRMVMRHLFIIKIIKSSLVLIVLSKSGDITFGDFTS
ncbi:hypothetical protein D083_2120 [Dickeya solani RNS 08.23.3.1.A]|nr:hypothetical protein D083_2120 [Dickeya solani RNS 08.23.3.1.A]